jgi:hypothetical protein
MEVFTGRLKTFEPIKIKLGTIDFVLRYINTSEFIAIATRVLSPQYGEVAGFLARFLFLQLNYSLNVSADIYP